ncbi:DddA-like double-stranded DNA deaminase toxin [Actinokineospora cianjurensis]|uniref:Nucleic acid/nucleotide deaminase of polymorphic system toxin n=1 Tax=Actinokineospora cianjurensis TaxID=585224 RepID=A0A421B5D8_9PSEU|nr:DddA-like double-stranded DNA deaminase toxin [Actinokineospora cianjurensis]RLK59676.1 nucleic acid/nucleotide deaminase of polymorphic system toxin [Actinokineospora cianjurensis]
MTGILEINGTPFGELSATRQDDWARGSAERSRQLGIHDDAEGITHHVEMKAVIVMITSGATRARVIINHAPCGSEPGLAGGCHRLLPWFIPRGSSLTVLGTDAQGEPFQRIYEGRAAQ